MSAKDERLTFTFVTDGVKLAIAQAKRAAGERVVQVVGGPNVVPVMPVMLGGGLRLLEDIEGRLEKGGVQEVGARTSLSFRVVKWGSTPWCGKGAP